jgi:hypothetical protein
VSPPNVDDEQAATVPAALEAQLEQMRLELSSIRTMLEERGPAPPTV